MCCRGMKGLVLGITLLAAGWTASLLSAEDKKTDRLFELRIYTAHDGKFEDLHKRFREHTNKLFVKHGMDLVGYWVPTDGPESKNTLIYLLAYPDKAARETSWKAFLDDPDWKAAYKESHKNGPLVAKVEAKFLAPTDYSPIK
ncbi:MAG: NIPSNAP family protein [Planctomycetota bacterium]